jgi:crotonobetainyl-CoA:carnitine CoA-transferase CaiB-like acyl-CoA transferase
MFTKLARIVKWLPEGVMMAGPLEGIKVVELGVWVAGPAAGRATRRRFSAVAWAITWRE